MKQVIIIALIFKLAVCRPQLPDGNAKITWYENFNDGQGNSKYGYTTSNGIINTQEIEHKQTAHKRSVISMRGFFAFVSPDNSKHEVRYVSDENGYHPQVTLTRNVDLDKPKPRSDETVAMENDEAAKNIGTTLEERIRAIFKNATASDQPIINATIESTTLKEADKETTASFPIVTSNVTTMIESVSNTTEEVTKETDKETRPEITSGQPTVNVTGEFDKNATKNTVIPVEFPDRIGQTAIITLQGPPG